MARTITDARQVTLRTYLDQIALQSAYTGTADAKPANQSELDNLLAAINNQISPLLRMSAASTPSLVVSVGSGDVTDSETNRRRAIPHVGTAYVQFSSGTVTLPAATGGNIVCSPGTSTVLNCASGNYCAILVYLDGNGQLNTITGTDSAVLATAITNLPPSPDETLPLGFIIAHNTGGTIDNVTQANIAQFGTGAGGGSSGNVTSVEAALRDYNNFAGTKYLDPNIFKTNKATKVDGSSTGSFDLVKNAFKLTSIGQTFVSTNLANAEFLAEGIDITDAHLYLHWLSGFIDTAASYHISRDGGTNWQAITMSRVGTASNAYRGYLKFADETTQQSLQTVAASGAGTALNATSAQELSSQLVLTTTSVVRQIQLQLNYGGVGTGTFRVKIVKNSGGVPSTALADLLSESNEVTISVASLGGTGDRTVTVDLPDVVLTAGTYHVVLATNSAYKAGTLDLSWRSGAGTNGAAYNGTTWTGSASTKAATVQGRAHDLRVRVTAGTATTYLEGMGVYFPSDDGMVLPNGTKNVQRFYFTGDSNTTQFTLNWTPDPDLLDIIDPYRGQMYAIEPGVAKISGQTVTFASDTFNFPGEDIVLIFRQVKGTAIDNSDSNAAKNSEQDTNLLDIGNQISDLDYVSVPLMSVPNTAIVGRSAMPDLSQDLNSRMGINRIMVQSIYQLQNEFGASGEPVFAAVNDRLNQIRFVGGWRNLVNGDGQRAQGDNQNDYVEITFYGTGLNLLTNPPDNGNTVWAVGVDGASPSGDIAVSQSTILQSRSYNANVVINAVTGLSLGIHTVVIKKMDSTGNGIFVQGFEILNEQFLNATANTNSNNQLTSVSSTLGLEVGMDITGSGIPANTTIASISGSTITMSASATATATGVSVKFGQNFIKVNPGIQYVKGKSKTLAAQDNFAYNSGFETGTLGTRGGRVLVYQKSDGTIARAVQPADVSSATLSSASHSNEEIIRTYHYREFGAGRTDDFSLISPSQQAAAFTLDDGVTTLVASASGTDGTSNLGINVSNSNGGFLTFTFVGTGLDIIYKDTVVGGNDSYYISIDGGSNIAWPYTAGQSTSLRALKIVSGLPYGTHTIKFGRTTATTWTPSISRFIIYQPKTPTLPTGAKAINAYNIMGNYTASASSAQYTVANGVLRKMAAREFVYSGPTTILLDKIAFTNGGWRVPSGVANATASYTFFGTGFEANFYTTATNAMSYTLSVDGATNLSGFTTSFSQPGTGVSFTASTGVVAGTSNTEGILRVRVSGLPLGLHTFKVDEGATNAQEWVMDCLDIITPIHSPKSNLYADLQNTLTVGSQGIEDQRKIAALEQITSQKAWAQAVGITNGPTTSSTSLVPMPDMSVTIKVKSGLLDISYSWTGTTNGVGGQNTISQVYLDGVAIGNYKLYQPATANLNAVISDRLIVPVSEGVHKVDLYWQTSAGTASTTATNRNLVVREL